MAARMRFWTVQEIVKSLYEDLVPHLVASISFSLVPLLLLESFMMGAFCASVPFVSYLLWVKPRPFPRAPFISILWIALAGVITHWAFSLRQLAMTLNGRSFGISLSLSDLSPQVSETGGADVHVAETTFFTYISYARAWTYIFPLVTETALFGFSSFCFGIVAYTRFRKSYSESQRHSWISLLIPGLASVIYVCSSAHWAIFLWCFTVYNPSLTDDLDGEIGQAYRYETALVGLLSITALLSDSIVLWRMCVVWDRTRTICAFAAVLLAANIGLCITNFVLIPKYSRNFEEPSHLLPTENLKDTEIIDTYGGTYVGLTSAYVSLASNLCATMLVGTKFWLHKRRVTKYLHRSTHRTLAERVMELLVDSGVIYTSIWLLYCISFYRPITIQKPIPLGHFVNTETITAVSHLDAAMAQIKSIYPLMVFILIALDKIHYSRGPPTLHTNDLPMERGHTVSITVDVNVERSTTQSQGSTNLVVALHRTDNDLSAGEG